MKSRAGVALRTPNKKNAKKINRQLGKKKVKIPTSAEKTAAKTATQKAISLVKLVGISMKLMEQNNHLQGLYAELGKMLYEQQQQKKRVSIRFPEKCSKLAENIAEMRRKMAVLENEAAQLKKIVHHKQ